MSYILYLYITQRYESTDVMKIFLALAAMVYNVVINTHII